MSLSRIKRIILILTNIFLLVYPLANIWAAGTVYTFSEGFESTDHKGAGTTADWNTTNKVLQLPGAGASGNTKQINGSITAMGANLYYAWIDFRGGIGDDKGHIYLRMFDKAGTIQGASDVQVDSVYSGSYISDSFFATYVKVINDGVFVYVYWIKDNKLFLQKFNSSASRQWNSGDFQVNDPDIGVTDYNYGYVTGLVNNDGTLSFIWDSGSGVYMQRVDPTGTGVRIGDSIRLLGSATEPAYVDLTAAGNDSSNNYYLIYSSYNYTNSKKELFLDKFDASGVEAWSGSRVTIASASTINGTDIATDASGNSYIVWSQTDYSSLTGQDVYITAINASGSVISGWTAKKVYTDTNYNDQSNPRVKLDSTNAPNVLWEDTRTTGKLDLYAQRYNTSGTAQWASTGVKVNIGDNPSANALYYTGYDSNFVIDTAGADNSLYVAWYAYRSSDYDVFSQKVTAAGANSASDWTITQVEAGGGYLTSEVMAVSDDVLYPNSTPVLSAKIYGSYYANGQTIKLYLSNDGTTYESVTSGVNHTFNNASGTSLYWKAELSSTNPFVSPVIYSLLIEYTVAGHDSPYHKILYIYDDSWHYQPTGWMAENDHTDAMHMVSNSPDTPAQGSACVKITYDPNRAAWAGFYVQADGKWRAAGGKGIDMSNYSAMIIKARAADSNANAIQVQFGVGGDAGDTVTAKTNWMTLTTSWQTFAIDLSNKDLTSVNGLVMVNMRRIQNIDPVIYIDDIQFIGPGPSAITNLKALLGSTAGSVNLTWTAPAGDYPNTSYIVKYSPGYISNQTDFSSATTYTQSWTPGAAGTVETHSVTDLTPGQGYYFAVATVDNQGNQSDMSNVYYGVARTSGIGILVEGDVIDLGTMGAGGTKTGGPITVTNIGGVPMTTSLSVTNPPGWAADSTNTTANHYILLGAFGSSEGTIFWTVSTQVLSPTMVRSTTTRFAGDQTGANIPVDGVRRLYIRFTAPLTLDVGTSRQEMIVNVTAGAVD
ncbi:MAG: fibronectin type III domain-containing protein [bacterium]|nr:fibronectin type III domain-containing protein [bacterium]